jgi:hypothetical protein
LRLDARPLLQPNRRKRRALEKRARGRKWFVDRFWRVLRSPLRSILLSQATFSANGRATVRFAPCGGAVCGAITWKRDANANGNIGQRVFFDMKPAGESAWAGSAFNPEDGRNYSAKMTLAGDHLTTAGCVFGGLICKSEEWTRAH